MHTLSHSKKCLFGGTILAAGLLVEAAPAQTFDLTYSLASAYGQGTLQNFNGAGPFSVSTTSYSGGTADAWGNAASIGGATSFTYGYGYMAASAISYFSVTSDGTFTASWDLRSDPTYTAGYVSLWDWTNSVLMLQEVEGSAGTQDFALTVGTEYRFHARPVSSGTHGSSFAELAVPAPGAVALLGCAGVLATRRRRE